jgi:hypothetical protein
VGETYVWEKIPLEDLASLGEFSGSEDARLLAYVGSLDDASLVEPLTRPTGPEGMEEPSWAFRTPQPRPKPGI